MLQPFMYDLRAVRGCFEFRFVGEQDELTSGFDPDFTTSVGFASCAVRTGSTGQKTEPTGEGMVAILAARALYMGGFVDYVHRVGNLAYF